MVGFKDMVAEDLDVFINPEEHAEVLDIDGNEVMAVFERCEGLIPFNDLSEFPRGDPGVVVEEYELSCKMSDLPLPRSGQAMTIDGDIHHVKGTLVEDGLLTIFTYRYGS